MKKIQFLVVFLFLSLIFSFLFKNRVSADHTCYTSCGTPSWCPSPLTCSNGLCKNPSCLSQTDCICENYTIQGVRVLMPGNQQGIEPYRSAGLAINPVGGDFSEEDPDVRARKAYFYNNLTGSTSYTVTIDSILGASVGYTACYNDTSCHSNTPTAGSTFTADTNKVDSENFVACIAPGIPVGCDAAHYTDVWWHFTPLTPNCKNISAPSSVFVGDDITISADYENDAGPLSAASMYIHEGGLGTNCNGTSLTSFGSSPPTYSFSWTPTATGNYTVYCQATNTTNPTNPQCRGDCYSAGPPIYACLGSDNNGAGTNSTITVSNPSSWYKLKNASLYKLGGFSNMVTSTINKFTDSDTDDTGARYTILGNNGVGSTDDDYSPGPSYDPITLGTNDWHHSDYTFSQSLVSGFTDYVKGRKENVLIDNLSAIQTDKINLITGDQTIDDLILAKAPFVLIINGNVAINNDFNNGNPVESISIISSGKITFGIDVTYANGVFIANDVEVAGSGAGASDVNGLKIKGNLVSTQAITNNRNRTDNSRPSLFIVLDPDQFIDLLPLVSTSKYDFQQTQ